MRMRVLAFALVALMAVACGTSDVADEAEVVVSGVLAMADGAPASGVRVALVPQPSGLDALAEFTATVTSVGMLCLAEQVALCKGTRHATTAADGSYSFTMRGEDTKTILGNPVEALLTARAPSGAWVDSRFELSKEKTSMPRLAFWEPAGLSVSSGRQSIVYSWPPMVNEPKPSGYRLTITAADGVVWSQQTGASGKLDARVVADAQAEFTAVAVIEQDEFRTEHHSPPSPLRGTAGVPHSRDSACSVAGRDGAVTVSPCPVTDGAYRAGFPVQSCATASPSPGASPSTCSANTWIAVDLGRPQSISAVVLHGLVMPAGFEISTSDDGLRWTKRAQHKRAEYALVSIKPTVTARYLRLQSTKPSEAISGLAELSAWP